MYDVTDHGPVTSYVGIEFTRNREARTGFISMKKYTQKVIANFGMANCNAVNTPYICSEKRFRNNGTRNQLNLVK